MSVKSSDIMSKKNLIEKTIFLNLN